MTMILERYGQHLKPGNLQIHQTVLLQRNLNLKCVQPIQVKINYRNVLCSLAEQMGQTTGLLQGSRSLITCGSSVRTLHHVICTFEKLPRILENLCTPGLLSPEGGWWRRVGKETSNFHTTGG